MNLKIKNIFSNNRKVFFIAEGGVNHNGSTKIAKKLIDVAVKSGADAIKFQTFKVDELLTKNAKSMKHQLRSNKSISQYIMLKKLELNEKQHLILQDYCKKKKIIFFSTAFDNKSLLFLKKINIPIFKVPSSELNNIPYLKILGSFNMPVILSTGMSYESEVREAIKVLQKNGTNKKKIVLLHCTSQYPSNFKDLNLNVIKTLKKKFNCSVGYSDHSHGFLAPLASVALGSKVIEKHFTLSRKMSGPDHLSSLEPKELNNVISLIRNLEISLGKYEKKPTRSEIENRKLARKSIVAKENIKIGERFSINNITVKRPGTGLSPKKYFNLIGKKSKKNYFMDDLIYGQ